MHALAQVLLDALFTGASFALTAAGLALILGVVKVVDLSHGAFFSLGAYVAYVLAARNIVHPAAAVAVACVAAFSLGILLGKGFVNPVRSHPVSVAVGTLGFAILFEQGAQLLWGPHPASLAAGPPLAVIHGVVVRRWGAVSLLSSCAILAGLSLFLSSRWGLPLRLIAEDEEIAESVGMDVEKIRYLTFGTASAAAAAAGALLAPAMSITPTMGRVPLILSLIVVIASGMDNIGAIFCLAAGLGILSNAGAYFVSPQWSYAGLLAMICVLLLVRPEGLSGAVAGRESSGWR